MRKIKQVKIGDWWGTFKLLAQHITSYVQYLILGFSAVSAYAVLRLWAAESLGLNIPFWLFIMTVLLVILLLFLWEYRYSWRSFFAVWNRQIWDTDNPLKDEISKIRKEIREIRKLLEELK